MATAPATSISSSYQRLGGSTPVIKGGEAGPALSAATLERLRLTEQRKLEEEMALAKRRRLASMSPLERSEELGKQAEEEVKANQAVYDRMNAAQNRFYHFNPKKYTPKPGELSYGFKGIE